MMSHEVVNFHEHTPNKRRSVMTDHAFQPTNLYRSVEKSADSSSLNSTQQAWIGKYFVPEGFEPEFPNKHNYVLEHDIARATNGIFHILFIGRPDAPKYMSLSTGIDAVSKPNADYHPNRVNIFVDTNDIIQRIEYF